jgi:hypothetical protein
MGGISYPMWLASRIFIGGTTWREKLASMWSNVPTVSKFKQSIRGQQGRENTIWEVDDIKKSFIMWYIQNSNIASNHIGESTTQPYLLHNHLSKVIWIRGHICNCSNYIIFGCWWVHNVNDVQLLSWIMLSELLIEIVLLTSPRKPMGREQTLVLKY